MAAVAVDLDAACKETARALGRMQHMSVKRKLSRAALRQVLEDLSEASRSVERLIAASEQPA